MSSEQRFKLLARSLPGAPTADQLADLAQALSEAAATAPESPGRRAALLVRHHVLARHGQAIADRVRATAADLLPDAPRRAPAPVLGPTWVPLEDSATILGQPVAYILARLPDPVWRRAWGWPRWVGPSRRHWLFARAAIDGATAAAVLAAQPVEEPPYPLPPWCATAADSEGSDRRPSAAGQEPGERTSEPDVPA
jgi:hypothetical protein